MVFGRLNSGGDKLTPQESRNALFAGDFNFFCIKLSKNNSFRKLWNYTTYEYENGILLNEDELLNDESYRKMEDVEMILRFFAYRHLDQLSNFKSQEQFLDNFLKNANNYGQEIQEELEKIFEKTVNLVLEIFGESAFYMPESTQKKYTPTKTIYDSLMQSVSKYIDRKDLLIEKSEIINSNKFKDFSKITYKSKGKQIDLFDGKYNSKNNVESRIEYFDSLISESIN